jgi:tetratricopeptide (TPR) repeat protein
MQTFRRAGLVSGLVIGLVIGLALACGSDANRVQYHLGQADSFLAEGRGREALIELHSAARLEPGNVDLSLRVAETSLRYGFFGDAVDFYRDALSFRPEDSEAQLNLAQLLLELDPSASKARVNQVLARDPGNAKAWLIRARASLIAGDVESAMSHIAQARRIDLSEPEIDRVMALAYETRGRAARARNPMAVPAPRVTQSILRAYERYLAKDGEYPLMGYLGRARTLSQLPGHSAEALEAFAQALDQCQEIGSPYEHVQVAREATRVAQLLGDPALAKRAAQFWIDTTPRDMDAWRSFAELSVEDPEAHQRRVYEDLVRSLPDLPEAHVLYAHHLLHRQGYSRAVDYLNERLGQSEGEGDALLLIGISDLQNRSQRFADAAKTLEKLQAQFPDLPAAALALGEHQVLNEQFEAGAATLQAGLREQPTSHGYRLLARAEQRQGNLPQALAAINKAIALANRADPNSLRLKAQIHSEMGQHAKAGNSLLRLERKAGLRPQERLSLALSYYLRGTPGVGRKFLIQLLEAEDAGPRAALEFSRWDGQNPRYRPAVRHHLASRFKAFPNDTALLTALTEMDWADGRVEEARARLNAAIDLQSWVGKTYLIRGDFLLGLGELVAARDDAERALRLDPSTSNEAYNIMTAAYMNSGDLPNLVAAMEAQAAKRGLSADRLGLLARLNLGIGKTVRALELYEQALDGGSDLHFVKNDLAYLLASLGGDLDRALALARMATEAPGENVSAVDTLGYVYLKMGKPDAAVWQFRQAVSEAAPPVPDYYFHLGLALVKLGKAEQARAAFQEALALNPEFSDAEQARQFLNKNSGAAEEEGATDRPAS